MRIEKPESMYKTEHNKTRAPEGLNESKWMHKVHSDGYPEGLLGDANFQSMSDEFLCKR